MTRYNEVVSFIEANHRNPSKYVGEERDMVNWLKVSRKTMNARTLKPERVKMFKKLQELADTYKRKNQYE